MARMHPSALTPAFTGYAVPAEKIIYDKAKTELPDAYHVFHDLKWDDPSIQDSRKRGQIDFVVAHPDRGLITLEVKGGRCDYEPDLRTWTSMDGDNKVHEITDPFDQASSAARVIRKLLSAQPALRDTYIPHHQAVVFPDCEFEKRDLRADALKWQILDQKSLFNFKKAVDQLFEQALPQRLAYPDQGQRIVQELARLHGNRALHGRAPTDLKIRRAGEELLRLTNEQLTVLQQLREMKRVVVRGCAGSGKTTLAVHKAKIEAEKGRDVLLVCFNKPLSAYLKSCCTEYPNITVGGFHDLCLEWLQETGRDIEIEDSNKFYSETLPELVYGDIDLIPHRYGTIIVDEGQDFKDAYWIVLESLFEDPDDAVFYVFADSSQNIYEGSSDYPMTMSFRLDRNLRNTDQVFRVVKRACELAEEIQPSGVSGPSVRVASYDSDKTMLEKVETVLGELVQEGITADDIAILGTRSQRRTDLRYSRKIGPYELVESRNDRNQIVTMTIHRFKGLESPVVILCELDETIEHNLRELLYIGLTRTTGLLYILVRKSAEKSFAKLLGL
jgi:hypothetical protein